MKKFSKILAMVMVALMMMSVVVFADDAATEEPITATVGEKEVVTVVLNGLKADEEATILVVNDGVTDLSKIINDDIVYIDQLTVAKDNTVTFTLDASKANDVDGKKIVDIYCGYTSMDVAEGPLMCLDLLVNPVDEPEFVYGDVDGNGTINATDAGWVLRKAGNSTVVFPNNVPDEAANVDGNDAINATDAGWVLRKAGNSTVVFPAEQ